MLKITAVVWQSYYNVLFEASKSIEELKINIYSSRTLENDPTKLKELFLDLDDSDIVFVYRSSEPVWNEIDRKISTLKSKIVYLGHDPSTFSLSNVDPLVLKKAHTYLIINGKKNVKNMLLFLANTLGGFTIPYDEPQELPWEGLYHPDAEKVYSDIHEYLAWYERKIASRFPPKNKGCVGVLFSRHYWVKGNTEVEDLIIRELERAGFKVISGFGYSVKDISLGTKGTSELIVDWFMDAEGNRRIDALIKLISFFISANRKKRNDEKLAQEGVEILKKLNVPVFSPISSYYKTVEEWEREELSIDIGWAVALPEFEGVIEPIIVSAQKEGKDSERRKVPIEDRVKKLVERVSRWIELGKTNVKDRRIAFVLHNNPCASVEATVGSAANLDSLESVVDIMKKMKEVGYEVDPPESGKTLIEMIMNRKAISEFRWTTVEEIVEKGGALAFVDKEKYFEWFSDLPEKTKKRMIASWGEPPGEYKNGIPPAMVYKGKIVITGLKFGNAVVMVQPKRGCAGSRCDGQVCRILHDPDTPPPHQYVATYKWLSREFRAHAVVHVGTHGNLEFLPGKGVGLSSACLPDISIDLLPHIYIYNADNPPEGTVAKRRSYATLIDHMQTVLVKGGLYDELSELDRLVEEYENALRRDPSKLHALKHKIFEALAKTKLIYEIKIRWKGKKVLLSEISEEEFKDIPFEAVIDEVHSRLSLLKTTQIQDGMHIFGRIPEGDRKVELIYSILSYDAGKTVSLRKEVAKLLGYDTDKISVGALSDEIDRVSKEIIRKVLEEDLP